MAGWGLRMPQSLGKHGPMMMRAVMTIVVLFSVSGALAAQDWHRYVNPRFGTAVDIPAEFTADGAPAVPGEGKRFRAANGRASITVWGGPSQSGDFLSEMRARIAGEEAEGWAITYRSETPDWASWSGSRAGHVFFAKALSTCQGTQTANVRLDYPAMDIARFDDIVTRLGQSLGQDGACF